MAKHFVGEKVIVRKDISNFNEECQNSDVVVTEQMLQFAREAVTIDAIEYDADKIDDGYGEYHSLYLIKEDKDIEDTNNEGFFWEDRMFE